MTDKIRKRDGSVVAFDAGKIKEAIWKAVQAVGGKDMEESDRTAEFAVKLLNEKFAKEIPSVEDIQDIVEKALIERGHATTAKAYILYRHKKSVEREVKGIMGVKDDLKLSLNSIQVLERRYLLKDDSGKIMETPGGMFRRVAKFIASGEKAFGGDEETVKDFEEAFYEAMIKLEFIPNSPTLMNAGTGLGQLSACFVLGVTDDLDDIFETVKNTALIHKSGGGTGFSFSYLRPKGDFVKSTAGVASGPISFMTIFDVATNVVKQGGKRRGANMGVMEIWHPDIEEFITVKQTPGVLENFNISVGVDNRFMKALEEDSEYDLINPRTGQQVRKVKAKGLFNHIAYSAWKSAEPGILFMDTINNANPTPKERIVATNPCISGDTLVCTNEGLVEASKVHNPHHVIGSDGKYHPVRWAGQTGEKELFLVKTNAGYEAKATAEHKFLTEGGWKEVRELTSEDRLVLQKQGKFGAMRIDREMALALGWLVSCNHMSKDAQDVIFHFGEEEKAELLPVFREYFDRINGVKVKPQKSRTGTRLKYSSKIAAKFREFGFMHLKAREKEVPSAVFSMNEESVGNFLSALFGASGSVQSNSEKEVSIRLSSSSIKLLKQVQVLLLQFGIVSRVYERRRGGHAKILPDSKRQSKEYSCKAQHELMINRASMFLFMNKVGFAVSSKNEKFAELKPKKAYSDDMDSSVASVTSAGFAPVYDLTEPQTHSFSANGLIVHNCGEVPMPNYESCNLASINLAKFVEIDWSRSDWKRKINWKRLRYIVRLGVQFLDNVIELNKYPIPKIKEKTLYNRRIGLGVMGFAKMLFKMGIKYDSDEAFRIGEEVMKFITEEARKMSHELGRARGSFPGFADSVWAKKYDGMRNATVTSIAPTGTISMIADTSSGIEPVFSLAYVKIVMDGTRLYYSDDTFEHVLKVRGLYSPELMQKVIESGSIAGMEEIPKEVTEIFRVAYDVRPEAHVRMQAAFQKYTDLAVSKTINLPPDATVEDVQSAYMLAWRTGCKGITVYREGSRGEGVLAKVKPVPKAAPAPENPNPVQERNGQ